MRLNELVSNDKVFLGGTCGDSTWREDIIPALEENHIDYFNPVVDVWDDQAQVEEDEQKENCSIHLYGLSKDQKGAYTFFEIPYSLIKGKKVIVYIDDILENSQLKDSIEKIIKDLSDLGIGVCYNTTELLGLLGKKE